MALKRCGQPVMLMGVTLIKDAMKIKHRLTMCVRIWCGCASVRALSLCEL